MLDKIIIVSQYQAYLIYEGREPIGIHSDECVRMFLLWIFGDKRAHLVVNDKNKVTGIELRIDSSDEVTIEIEIKEIA